MEHATLRGLMELIERDALSLWWYCRARRPGVDLEAWHDNDVQRALYLFSAHNRSLHLLDVTTDIGIPVYVAVSSDADGRNICYASAAGVCGVDAAKQALAEVIQFWFQDKVSGPTIDRALWMERGSLTSHPYLSPHGRVPIPQKSTHTYTESLHACARRLSTMGVEAFTVDLTRPELGIPVVRVIAPGLRHYGPRFAHGRLFDVPVKLGWLPVAPSQTEMNEEPCVL